MKHDSRLDIRIDAVLKQKVQQKLEGKKISDFVRASLEEYVKKENNTVSSYGH